MKIGLIAPLANPMATPGYVRMFGQTAERLGFHSLWVAEHVVRFDRTESVYPYSPDGQMPAQPENGFLEPFTALAFLAGVTDAIRLGTGICLVPQRNPVYTAKEAAAVDWLSAGRLDFGVGVGWLREEFEAVGMPFSQRGARCRAYLEVIRRLWCDPVAEYQDAFYQLEPCRMDPKPVQDPHPPIYFGGESEAALKRVADLGQGWFGLKVNPQEVERLLPRLDEFLDRAGRQRNEVRLAVSPYFENCDADTLEAYASLGVDQVIVPAVPATQDSIGETLEALSQQLVEPARKL